MNLSIETQVVNNSALLMTITESEGNHLKSSRKTLIQSDGQIHNIESETVELIGDEVIFSI